MLNKLALLAVSFVLFQGCDNTNIAPQPESDSSQDFRASEGIPVDDGVYTIQIQVVGDVESLTRQTQAASGSMVAVNGYASGSYYGPEFGGKGFIRGLSLESDSYLAPVGQIVILKSSDTKGAALLPGDVVTLKCRHQYEAVAAVLEYETFDADKLGTWEIDYCRLITPVISVQE